MSELRVLVVSPEVTPFAKTGGMADVCGSLPLYLRSLDCDIRVFLPGHRSVQQIASRARILGNVEPIICGLPVRGTIRNTRLEKKVTTYFVENDALFDREYLYGTPEGDYPDNLQRFTFFARSAFELCALVDFWPHVFHCHDWQSGLIPVYLRTMFADHPELSHSASVLTIHNLAYQGLFPMDLFPLLDIPEQWRDVRGLEFWGKLNFLKGAIQSANVINTVSENYSREIQTEELGCGLDGVLRDRRDDLFGILNGTDYTEWDPRTDPYIAAHYTSENLEGKVSCKRDLLETLGLPEELMTRPVVGMITRLAAQKGLDIVAECIDEMLALEVGFVLLGTGDQKYHEMFQRIGARFPQKAAIRLGFDNELAHKIEAGSDIFLMPSRYEPCGLNQIYSLRYGTIPLVRATGGLDDTIRDYDPATGSGNGFKFEAYSARALMQRMISVLELYRNRAAWTDLMRRAMREEFTWARSASKYMDLYRLALQQPRHRA
ncbi:MAG: glycogen synthase GlgA [Deltaproteobacteria bacterium]|nr:glycogen synthase GlgA [Deltaproteobacteria bacterium]